MFMISGFSEVSMTPKTNMIHHWRHQAPPNNQRRNPQCFFENIITGNFRMSEHDNFESFGNDGAKNPDDPSNKFLKIFDMGSISPRKHEMEFW